MGVLGSLPEEDPAPHAPTKSAQALIIIFVFNGLTPEGIQHENENCKSWTIFRIRVMGILRYLTAQRKYNQSRWVGVFDGGVGAGGGAVPVGIVTIGELDDVLPPPPQDESNTHTASLLRQRSFNQSSLQNHAIGSISSKHAGDLTPLVIVNVNLTASSHADCTGCISFQSVIRSSSGIYRA